jgi:hypothetical protein
MSAFSIFRRKPKVDAQYENNEYIIESWLNGNRSYVSEKFRNMRGSDRGTFLQQAKETMTAEDYDDLNKWLYQ